MKKALLVIDVQNDYFPGGKFPLWHTEETLDNIEKAILKAESNNVPVIIIQHVADSNAPFFNEGTEGVEVHPGILKAAPHGKIVIKTFADTFHKTNLAEVLSELGVEELLVCGMMTHNCVTHTAISKSAEKYSVKILPDCCTTVDELIHLLALDALSIRIEFVNSDDAI